MKKYWYSVILISVLLAGVICFLWYREVTTYVPDPQQLNSSTDVKEYLGERMEENNLYVPTGIFIQSMEFVNSSDANITGYIWQKYNDKTPADISHGFIFPEQVRSEDTFIRKEYSRENEHGEVVGWYFDVTLRQPFDYSKYPLDKHTIWIRIWHKDFDRKVVLVPDFSSYDMVEPGKIFGVDYDLVPGSWKVYETYFKYKEGVYDTDFGIDRYMGRRGEPELHFNIVVGRRFIDAFIINLVPLITVTSMLFFTLLTVTSQEKRLGIFGFTAAGSIGTAATLLFVIMLPHIQIRKKFSGAGIVYIEQFYFVIYIIILLLSLNIYFFSANNGTRGGGLIGYRDNLIPKIAFWPVVFLALTIITLIYF